MGHFISYSRHDKRIIAPLVLWLRTAVPDKTDIFRDEDSIPFGDNWETHINAAIRSCDIFYVFWCAHSASSDQVQREIRLAKRHKKRIIPILIDHTRLKRSLDKINAIPFQDLGLHSYLPDAVSRQAPPREAPRTMPKRMQEAIEMAAEYDQGAPPPQDDWTAKQGRHLVGMLSYFLAFSAAPGTVSMWEFQRRLMRSWREFADFEAEETIRGDHCPMCGRLQQ